MTKEIIDESEYLRVTTPLRRFSGYDSVPTVILDQAADRGTRVHTYCDLYASKMLFGDIDPDCVEYVQAFIDWFDSNVESVFLTEKRFYCGEWMIQGMPDMVCLLKDKPMQAHYTLIDIKTSLKYSKTWDLQTAAYRYLCEKNKLWIRERMVVHLHKDATFDIIEYKDTEKPYQYSDHLNLYKGCLDLHRHFSE